MLGLDPDQLLDANDTGMKLDQAGGDYELPPELWDAWQCFVATWNQWRVHIGMTDVLYDGIDQGSLFACMQMLGIKKRKQREVFTHMHVLEKEARRLRNQKQ